MTIGARRLESLSSILLAVALAAVTPAFGQAAPPEVTTLHANSRLVALDVTVLDKSDRPVTDLRREDLTVYENGEPQRIQHFEAFSAHPLPSGLTRDSIQNTRDLQRVLPNAPVTVLVLDEFNTEFSDTAFARQAIKHYLTAQPAVLSQPTTFLAATDAGFQQIVDYTLNKERLLSGLAHLPAVVPGGLIRSGGTPEGRAIRFAQTLASLEQVASATTGHGGRKNVIWVGRGFESIDLRNEPDHQVHLVKAAAERAVNALREAHATVYTIDPTLSTKFGVQPDLETSQTDTNAFAAETHKAEDPFDGTVSFNTLAPETGGRTFAIMSDLDSEISTSVMEGSAYYTVSYVPNGPVDPEHPYDRIDVRVNRPGLRVVTRRGYYSVTPPLPNRTPGQQLKAAGFDLGNAISSGLTYTGLNLSVVLSLKDPMTCIIQVPTKEIQWQSEVGGGNSAHLTLVAVAFDSKGHPIGKDARDIVAKLGPEKDLADIPFTTLHITLPSATRAVSDRIAVRDALSGRVGTAEVHLESH